MTIAARVLRDILRQCFASEFVPHTGRYTEQLQPHHLSRSPKYHTQRTHPSPSARVMERVFRISGASAIISGSREDEQVRRSIENTAELREAKNTLPSVPDRRPARRGRLSADHWNERGSRHLHSWRMPWKPGSRSYLSFFAEPGRENHTLTVYDISSRSRTRYACLAWSCTPTC
jgi:hypothetical protein